MNKKETLLKQRKEIDEELAALEAQDKKDSIDKVKALMLALGVSIGDLKQKAGKRSLGKVAVKYLNTETGEAWTGRGRAPKWIVGKDRESFLVKP